MPFLAAHAIPGQPMPFLGSPWLSCHFVKHGDKGEPGPEQIPERSAGWLAGRLAGWQAGSGHDTETRAAHSSLCSGRSKKNLVPLPGWVSKAICPWWLSTMLLQMLSPSPVPPFLRVSVESACMNFSKTLL